MKLTLGEKAKAYKFIGVTVYLYRRVLDEISFPVEEKKRYHFTTGLGIMGQDKFVVDCEETLRGVLGDDYRKRPNGYMFVTESLKERIIEKFEREGA